MTDHGEVDSPAPGVQVVYVLVGPRASGKTTWAEQHRKEECYGWANYELLWLSRSGYPLGTIAISTLELGDIASSDDALSLKARRFLLQAIDRHLFDDSPLTIKVYVADHTRTLGNLYNLRLVYSKTTKLTNPYFGRAIFNRNAIIANNAIAMQTKDVDAVGSRCSVCNTTLPVGNDFSVVVHCNFPLCLHPAMLRPVPPIVGLHTSGVPAAFKRQVMLTNRNAQGASMTRCKMLFRYRQGGIGKERPESWTVGRTAYTAAYARNLVWPVALSPWKLVQFSVAIRVNRCTCGYDEETGTQTTVYECYKNHLRGVASCAATWTPWSKPSIRVFPPSKYEASFINRRAALLIRHTAENVAEYDSQSEEF